jgi:hypothetical protein
LKVEKRGYSKAEINGYRKTGQCGKVVNAEKWSMRKSGQQGKVVNAENWSTRKDGQRKTGKREKSAEMPSFCL